MFVVGGSRQPRSTPWPPIIRAPGSGPTGHASDLRGGSHAGRQTRFRVGTPGGTFRHVDDGRQSSGTPSSDPRASHVRVARRRPVPDLALALRHPEIPDALAVIGDTDDQLSMHYF